MSDHGTTTAIPPVQDLTQIRPGDHLEAWSQAVVRHRGIVEEAAPGLGVVWIRESGIGERRMLASDTFELRAPWNPVSADGDGEELS